MAERWDLALRGWPRISGVAAYDSETYDPDLDITGGGWPFPEGGHMVGHAFAWGSGRERYKLYLPIRHKGGGNKDLKAVTTFVRDTLKQTDLTLIMHHRLYDEGWLRREGIPVKCGKVYDTGTAASLIDEHRYSYGLDTLGKDYVGRQKNEAPLEAFLAAHNATVVRRAAELGLKGPLRRQYLKEHSWKNTKSALHQMPGDVVEPYGEDDADLTLDLWDTLKPILVAEDLVDIFHLETRLLPILLEMRWRGVRVDLDRAEQTVALFKRKEAELLAELRRLTGYDVDVWSADSLAQVFDALDLRYKRTPKTGKPSFRKEWLEDVDHPVADIIRKARQYNKTRTTFIEGYVLTKNVNGRVHGEIHPLVSDDGGAKTGRFSMSKPNLENLPNPEKDFEMGVAVRELFLPEVGEEWCAADYAQQEPRLTVHYASVAGVKGSKKAVLAWRANPSMSYHQFMADLTGLPKIHAKPINLGIGYGMGGGKLCRQLGLPTELVWSKRQNRWIEVAGEEGQAILDKYHLNAPFVKGLSEVCEDKAKERGYIVTILGRKCRFEKVRGEYYKTYRAMNKLIQGSAADQTKQAMIDLWDEGIVPLVPVHDELGCSVGSREDATRIADVMVNCIPLRVPVLVDVEMGPSWGATVKLED